MSLKTAKADGKIRDHVRILTGEQPYVHNHYTNDVYFRHDAQKGEIRNAYGQRVLQVPEDYIVSLSAALDDEVGSRSASEIMYKCGQRWGNRDWAQFSERVVAEFECDFAKLGMGMMLETWWWPLTMGGWGTWRYDFTHGKQGLIFVDLFESAVARSLGDVGKVVCDFYAGLFSSTFSFLARRDLATIEIQCYGMGEDFCKFLIATDKRVDAASFWREEGATSRDIMKKIKSA